MCETIKTTLISHETLGRDVLMSFFSFLFLYLLEDAMLWNRNCHKNIIKVRKTVLWILKLCLLRAFLHDNSKMKDGWKYSGLPWKVWTKLCNGNYGMIGDIIGKKWSRSNSGNLNQLLITESRTILIVLQHMPLKELKET